MLGMDFPDSLILKQFDQIPSRFEVRKYYEEVTKRQLPGELLMMFTEPVTSVCEVDCTDDISINAPWL